MMREPAPARLEATESMKTTDEVRSSPRMVFPGMLAIDDAVWSAIVNAASYRCELATRFHRSRHLCARHFGGINYEERACPAWVYPRNLFRLPESLLRQPRWRLRDLIEVKLARLDAAHN